MDIKINSTIGFATLLFALLLSSCSMEKRIAKEANRSIFSDSNLISAHVGITIYDPVAKKYLYNHQGNKYFIPASNTKLLTCYVAMKYLGDSLIGLRYIDKGEGVIEAEPSGDPTFLHPDFKTQPVYDFLKRNKNIFITTQNWKEKVLGFGWSWDDYNEDYMVERSAMPIHGNVVSFNQNGIAIPAYFQKKVEGDLSNKSFFIKRDLATNRYFVVPSVHKTAAVDIPFHTIDSNIFIRLLTDTLHVKITLANSIFDRTSSAHMLHSQPTDSLLKIMMHRSDNFFAEQSLLMVSNERLGYMNDEKIIDTLLKSDYKDMPQQPRWVDGSGLSRYNLITPQDFVFLLEKMKNEFSWSRITTILSTGGDGTLGSSYQNYRGKIYAKTGTLSNNVALSGYLLTNKGKQYIFSVMVNNHQTKAGNIRKSVEKFITQIIQKY